METFFRRLESLQVQSAYVLFRHCGVPRWTHITRCHTPHVSRAANERVDSMARSCMVHLIGGGCGMKENPLDNPFFAGDLLGLIPFVDLAPLAYGACHDGVFGPPNAPSQHNRMTDFIKAAAAVHTESRDPLNFVHERQLKAPGSRLWLECRPNRPEYMMRQTEYETALRARFLLPPDNDDAPSCVCSTQMAANQFVVHALDCKHVSGYTWASRHAHVKEVFKNVLRQYGFLPDHAEPRFFGNGKGPDVCFSLGSKLVLVDVTVVNPLADSYVIAESLEPGVTLRNAELRKDRESLDASTARNMEFWPLALTTFGIPGPESLRLIRRFARYTADPTGFVRHMLSALSVAVQVGNARILLAVMVAIRCALRYL